MSKPMHILVFRFSALGDVAMTVPVMKLLLEQYPHLQVTMVSAPFMQPLFENIDRLQFYGADTRKDFKGLSGLWRLSRLLRANYKYEAIADLHDVLRTKILRLFLSGKPLGMIDKGRSEKKELTRPVNKKLRPLKTTFQRYADVFERIGLPVIIEEKGGGGQTGNDSGVWVSKEPVPMSAVTSSISPNVKRERTDGVPAVIGIAPFARHQPKMYPLDKMKVVVALLQQHPTISIKLFGSREEASILNAWENEFPRVQSLAGKVSFKEELRVISTLNLMVSMDSANMHLASLQGVPVISIWGGTHPFLGFYGWQQSMDNAIQLDLPCRPSSVFGNKECPVHGTAGCMQDITPQMIYDKIISQIPQGA